MSIPCLIIAAVVDKHAGLDGTMEDRVDVTMALTCMIGAIMLLAGFLRLGLLINFISKTVLTGFVHASAFMVCASMTPKLLGVSIEKSPVIYETVPRTWDVLPKAKMGSLVLSAGGILLLFALNYVKSLAKTKVSDAKKARSDAIKRGEGGDGTVSGQFITCYRSLNAMFTCFSPVMLFVVAMVCVGGYMCEFERLSSTVDDASSQSKSVATPTCDDVKMVGDLPFGWPGVKWEWWNRLGVDLAWDAGSITMVILAEHVSNVKLYSSVHNHEVCMSAELMAIGITNCVGSLFSSFAVGARCKLRNCHPVRLRVLVTPNRFGMLSHAVPRKISWHACAVSGSAVNNSVGATSQVSLLVSGLAALALMPAMAPLLYFLPKPALSIVSRIAPFHVMSPSPCARLKMELKSECLEQVVMFAVAGVVDVNTWPRLWKVSRREFFVMASSFAATLMLGVLSGLGVAIAVSLGIFILNSSQPRIVELGRATGSVDYRALGAHACRASTFWIR